MTILGEGESFARLVQEWEELCQQSKGSSPQSSRYSHGDVNTWIIELNNPETRVQAMQNLCKFRSTVPDLGPLLWYSFGAISSLIQEVMIPYSKSGMTVLEASRVSDALTLLESVAEHPKTRLNFICSNLHEIVAPLAKQKMVSPTAEILRRRTLQIICALLKSDNADRGLLSGREHACILVQLLADNFLATILWNTAKYGQLPSHLLIIQVIDKIFANDEVLGLFLRGANNLKCVVSVLNHLNIVCQAKAPSFCIVLNRLYNDLDKFVRQFLAVQQTKALNNSNPVQTPQYQNDVRSKNAPGSYSYVA